MSNGFTNGFHGPVTDPACNDPAVRRPVSRYGRVRLPGRPRHWAVIVVAVAAIATGAAAAVIAYQRLGTPDVNGDLFGYQVIDEQTVSVTLSVTRADPSRPVVCIVRVRSADGSETGRREVLVGPAEAATVQVTTIVKSSAPPMMGDVYGCGTDVPGYLRSP